MKSTRILLVDDEPGLLEVCQEGLTDHGYTVLAAHNGEEALEILDREQVDLVISDMRMPRLGGLELLQEMGRRKLGAAVIVLTGYGTIQNAVECLQLGASDYLLKPFEFSLLIQKIEKVLQERRLKRYDTEVGDLLHILSLDRELSAQPDEPGLLRKFLHHVKKTFAPSSMAYFVPAGHDDAGMEPLFTLGPFFKREEPLAWFAGFAGAVAATAQPRLIDPLMGASGTDESFDVSGISAMAAPLNAFFEKEGVLAVVREARGEGGTGPNGEAFSLGDLQLFSIFAAHAGSAAGYHRSCRRIQRMNLEFVTSYVQAVEAKDRYTKGHSVRVRNYCLRLADALGLDRCQREDLAAAALLHDIGKIGIPDEILNKPMTLTQEEGRIMRRHPAIARDILSGVKSLQPLLPVIYHHHERYDGSGYPDGLQGKDIPFLARIIQVADGFEAMTSNRAYQRARAATHALDILQQGAGSQWDPQVVQAWDSVVRQDEQLLALGEAPAVGTGIS